VKGETMMSHPLRKDIKERALKKRSAQYNGAMSESIESRDPIWILQRALGHLKDQGKNVSNDDDVFELQIHKINVSRTMHVL
jgi:hypothetical protein